MLMNIKIYFVINNFKDDERMKVYYIFIHKLLPLQFGNPEKAAKPP